MTLSMRQPTLQLTKGELLSLSEAKALTLEVCRGRVWVTNERLGYDAFPAAGERLEIAAGSPTVIEALDDAAVQLRAVPGQGGRMFAEVAAVTVTAAASGLARAVAARGSLRRRAPC